MKCPLKCHVLLLWLLSSLMTVNKIVPKQKIFFFYIPGSFRDTTIPSLTDFVWPPWIWIIYGDFYYIVVLLTE